MSAPAKLVLMIVAAVALATAPAQARPRLGIEAYGGWSLYAMSDVNDSLSSFNRQIGTNLDPIHSGPAWGLSLRIWPHSDLLLRLGFESLTAQSEDAGIRFDLGTHLHSVSATYFIPRQESVRYGFGVGLSQYYPSGAIAVSGASLPTSGEGFGGHVTAEGIVPMTAGWSLNGILGYRWGRVDNMRFDGTYSAIDTDYSGLFLRIGIAGEIERRRETPSP